jgi:hypothetical protein
MEYDVERMRRHVRPEEVRNILDGNIAALPSLALPFLPSIRIARLIVRGKCNQ